MSATFSLEGKSAVVTGLSTGIGRAIAEALARSTPPTPSTSGARATVKPRATPVKRVLHRRA